MTAHTADILAFCDLSPADRLAWRSFCVQDPRQASPYFRPEFAQAVAATRSDVQVAVFRDAKHGAPLGFFAFHRRPGGLLRPIGAPVSDWQGPVLAPGFSLSGAALVDACRADAVRFSAAPAGHSVVAHGGHRETPSWYIDLSGGAEAFLAGVKKKEPKHIANIARCVRKAEREIGPVQFTFHDPDPAVMAQIIAWKREQFIATGKHDIFTARWIRALFQHLSANQSGDFGLVVSALRFGDCLAAGEIYLRAGDRLHAWISAYDRALLSYGPGQILTAHMAPEAAARGIVRIDFGAGGDEYKMRWCDRSEPAIEAVLHASSTVGAFRARVLSEWRKTEPALGQASVLFNRLRGRTEHVFAAHGSWVLATGAMALTLLTRRAA